MSETTTNTTTTTKPLNVAGWSKLSTVDWVGEIVTTVFLQGCPWKCNYCHNFEILDPNVQGEVSWENDVIPHLKSRTGLLDGIVFSGGEPLMQGSGEDGGALLRSIKEVAEFKDKDGEQAFKIGIHTGGAYPENLRKILPYLDWIGFDVKAPTGLYDEVTNLRGSEITGKKSLNLLLGEQKLRENTAKPLDITFRTTVDPTVLKDNDVERLKNELKTLGIENLVIQEVRTLGAPEEYATKLAAARTEDDNSKEGGAATK